MIVAVTGASGYLGRAVAAELVAAGHEVRALQRRPSRVEGVTDVLGSVTDSRAVARVVDGAEGIVHLAAKVSLAGDPADFHEVNVEGTRALLAAAEHAGASRFVQVSSPSVAHAGVALAGVGAEPASPQHARGEYARTKAEAELIALDRDSPAMRVVAVRP
ncbi:NAD-dependent epimerase/dehydratase family protein, partial [Microbacterium sp. zg.Y909]|uniref:NAD-dependent epimerase/dehydratase family protein n=1 Tax=Microbacterium sp. zg.Y909 TaxID=2969413 RepID=UPI00214BDF8F